MDKVWAAGESTLGTLTLDPANGGVGFARTHWATSINKMLLFMVPGRDNSVRALDPVTNSWEYLWPSLYGEAVPQARDNFGSFYVPRLDELWLWGGSYLEQYGSSALRSGRFHVSQKRWIASGTTDADAFKDILDLSEVGGAMPWNGADPATAWNAQLDMGMVCCGSGNSYSGDFYLIEPNQGGGKPYKATKLSGTLPPPRGQAMNLLVAANTDFYLFSGFNGYDEANRDYSYTRDFWKFSGLTRTWTRLPDPPGVSYQPTVTYDSDMNAVVAWINNHIYVYHIASNQWRDHTPSGLPCMGNQTGSYSPTAKLHIFVGGNPCVEGTPINGAQVLTVNIFGSQGVPIGNDTVPSNPPPQPPPSNPPSTLKATSYGTSEGIDRVGPQNQTTRNGIMDFHIKVTGLRSTPTKVRITSNTAGEWESPYNGRSWIVEAQYSASTGDLYFEQFTSSTFRVKVTYGDGTTDEVDVTNLTGNTPNPPPIITPPTVTPPPTGSGCVSGLCLQNRTWTAAEFPPDGLDNPSRHGGTPGQKQYAAKVNLQNSKIYFWGGDTNKRGRDYTDGWGATYALDLSKSLSDPNGAWTTEFFSCAADHGFPNLIQPKYPSENSWVYDSNRNKFYYISGFNFDLGIQGGCANESNLRGPPLTFDPVNKVWSQSPFVSQHASGLTGNSPTSEGGVYDPVTDAVYLPFGGMLMSILDLKTNQWSAVELTCSDNAISDGAHASCPTNSTKVNGGFSVVNNLWMDIDVQRRHIYFIKGPGEDNFTRGRLLRYNIDKKTVTALPTLPYDSVQGGIDAHVAFDSINNLVYHWYGGESIVSKLYIYHPDPSGGGNGRWEQDPMYMPAGIQPKGNGIVFDPIHNALVLYGGIWWHNEPGKPLYDPNPTFQTYYFLYRYGNGTGIIPPPPVVPPPVTPPPVVDPPPVVPPPVVEPPPVVTPISTLKAVYVGMDQDKVGKINQTTPNGINDYHVTMTGLRGNPTKITMTSDNGGIWETPFNGRNWIMATSFNNSAMTMDVWFEQFNAKTFKVKVVYADKTTDETNVQGQVVANPNSTLKAVYVGMDQDKVGKINQTTPNGINDYHVIMTGLRSNPTKITVTSDNGGIWETPFNGRNWIMATSFNNSAMTMDVWFEQFNAKTFKVKVVYADKTTDEANVQGQVVVKSKSTLQAVYFGSNEDKVGPYDRKPSGKNDDHIKLSGLRGKPVKIKVTGIDVSGRWDWPYNGHATVFMDTDGKTADLWMEHYNPKSFLIEVQYNDYTKDQASTVK